MTALLPTAYLAPISYYCQLYRNEHILIEQHEHYQKQTYRNRCIIAAPHGPQALTIPVVRQDPSHNEIKDILISDHGNWQHLHWQAFVTAYTASPFFEYYADDFRPFYERPWKYLLDFNETLRHTVCELIDLQPETNLTSEFKATHDAEDFRLLFTPKRQTPPPHFEPKKYYQVFGHRHGFLPDLSIVDLLFNMGPESLTVIRDSTEVFMN